MRRYFSIALTMATYVDDLVDYGWKLGLSCHLLADAEEELHELAAKIGMKRSWFQDGDTHAMPHYDLVASRRKLAVKKGAIEITRQQLYERLIMYRLNKNNHGKER